MTDHADTTVLYHVPFVLLLERYAVLFESHFHLKQNHDVAGGTMPPKLSTSTNLADVEELSDLNAQEWAGFLVSTTLNLALM